MGETQGNFVGCEDDTTVCDLWMCFLRKHFLDEAIDVDAGGVEELNAVVLFSAKQQGNLSAAEDYCLDVIARFHFICNFQELCSCFWQKCVFE